jgi:tRNA (guanine37-N1)-methyltransferase
VQIDILTLFPAICDGALTESMMKRAQEKKLAVIRSHNLRDWAHDKHRVTDDTPYGGGQGMVLKCEPIFDAVEQLRNSECGIRNENSPPDSNQSKIQSRVFETNAVNPKSKIVLMSPAGRRLDQKIAAEYAREHHLIILCGHYEGVDQRVIDHLVDDEISIGDYVLTNGAIAAAVFVDAVVRLIPGVLGDEGSAADDSFARGLLEFPQYTRPVEFRGWRVPDILLSGNHAAIAKWRAEQSLEKTKRSRPDLL